MQICFRAIEQMGQLVQFFRGLLEYDCQSKKITTVGSSVPCGWATTFWWGFLGYPFSSLHWRALTAKAAMTWHQWIHWQGTMAPANSNPFW
jgi:hypothetical protein